MINVGLMGSAHVESPVGSDGWTESTSAGVMGWVSVAMSRDGAYRLAANYLDDLYYSSDFGESYAPCSFPSAPGYFANVCFDKLSITPAMFAATTGNPVTGRLYTAQAAVGATPAFSFFTTTAAQWTRISASSWHQIESPPVDRLMVLAMTSQGVYYNSTNMSQDFSAGNHGWTCCDVTPTTPLGVKRIVGGTNSYLYKAEYGDSWHPLTAAGIGYWAGVAMEHDGITTHILAVNQYGGIYVSHDNGASFTVITTGFSLYCCAMSNDGTKMLVGGGANVSLLESNDSGATWTAIAATGLGSWRSVAMSANGLKKMASMYNGGVFQS